MNNRKNQRRETAALRVILRSERSDAEQLEFLEERGHGECKEAKRLRTSIAASLIR